MQIYKFFTPGDAIGQQIGRILTNAGYDHCSIDCSKSGNEAIMQKFGIKRTPVVIIMEDGETPERFTNVLDVRRWVLKNS